MTRRPPLKTPFPAVALALCVVLGACASSDASTDRQQELPSFRRVPIEDASWTGIAWLDEQTFAVAYLRGVGRERIGTLSLDGEFTPIDLPNLAGCRGTSYGAPASRDGQLFASVMCLRLEPDLFATHDVVTVDVSAAEVRSLLSEPALVDLGPVTPAPSGARAVVTVGGSLCSTLAIVESGELELLSLVIRDEDRSWSLEDGYPVPNPGHACTPFGQATSPAWDAGSGRFAFFASPASVGVDGQARADVPWNLYLMDDPTEDRYSILLEDILHARSLEWSPNGGWLAFSGEMPGEGDGVWLLHPPSRRLVRITDSVADSMSWSPDASRVAIVSPVGFKGVGRAEIVTVDVSDVLEGA
jgi:hypothetical protein